MKFDAETDGHHIIMDANEENGGENEGPRPKPLMLVALAGCTGMDVVSILRKMRVDLKELKIIVEGIASDEHPKKYTKINVVFRFSGNNLEYEKLEKAVKLSEEKYCGVNAVYKEVIRMNYEIKII
jgi:putative redox protein